MSGAIISNCGNYRYRLWRDLDDDLLGERASKTVLFIMLNPSTADASENDPTIRKCMGFAKRWQCTKLEVINLYSYRATDPKELKTVDLPTTGPEHHEHEESAIEAADLIVCAWGKHAHKADAEVMLWLIDQHYKKAYCLKKNKDGSPAHPLYQPGNSVLIPLTQ